MKMRGSKLRKSMLWPQGLFCVRMRRGDSKSGDLRPFHHVNPVSFFRYATVSLTCHVSLVKLPDPCTPASLLMSICPQASIVRAGTDLTGSATAVHPCLLLSHCGADNSYISSTVLWFLSGFGSPCAKCC